MIERFSYSSLNTFQKCPAQFRFRYIDKIRKPDDSVEAFMGKRVHEAIEYLYNEVLKNKIPFLDHVVDVYAQNWEEKWHDRISIVKNWNPPKYYFELGRECLRRFYRLKSPFEEPVEGCEVELNFTLDDDSAYRIKGFIDRLDHDGNGNYTIHDYKTSSRALSQNMADKDEQLALYHVGLDKLKGNVSSVNLVWHSLRQGIERKSRRSDQELKTLVNRTKRRIDEVREREKAGGPFPPKETPLCNWCFYWEECPAKRGTNPYVG